MTRSIGDFYMQRFGISWRPEVISVDLNEVGADLANLTLVVCSDGVWDLWQYEEVFEVLLPLHYVLYWTNPTNLAQTIATFLVEVPPTLIIRLLACWCMPCLPSRVQGVAQRYAPNGKPDIRVASNFFERSVERGIEMFDETSDNMTGTHKARG